MAKSSRRHASKTSSSSRSSTSTTSSYKTADSYESHSTAPSSVPSSSRPGRTVKKQQAVQYAQPAEDISPMTNCCPRSSAETYHSEGRSELELDANCGHDSYDSYQEIPPLPIYRREVVDPDVRPSTPHDFAKLFPSMNRLSIRHDDFTPDGNMNLRVDTVVPGRRRLTMQLFHLRMHDLGRREFSLRRYCRESGREVCNSKRKYFESASSAQGSSSAEDVRPKLQRSMTSALKSLGANAAAAATGKPAFRRTNSGGSIFSSKNAKASSHSSSSSSSSSSKSDHHKRPGSSRSHMSSSSSVDDDFYDFMETRQKRAAATRPVATNTIKLEFSNYARVDVTRRGKSSSKRYEFEWWGHHYAWKRAVDKNLGTVSFHLHRDDTAAAVAHVVPESRSPGQARADEEAGGWVPPCHMWIADQAVLAAMTDVADVIVATGLMALVDDCIKERWQQPKKQKRVATFPSVALPSVAGRAAAGVQGLFQRRHTDLGASPLRYANAVSAY